MEQFIEANEAVADDLAQREGISNSGGCCDEHHPTPSEHGTTDLDF